MLIFPSLPVHYTGATITLYTDNEKVVEVRVRRRKECSGQI